jgi:hypothetical protein
MNFLEALKTGRAIRRPDKLIGGCKWMSSEYPAFDSITVEDVLAEDWEAEPQPEQTITITRTQFTAAYAEAIKDIYTMIHYDPNLKISQALKDTLYNFLRSHLGLK